MNKLLEAAKQGDRDAENDVAKWLLEKVQYYANRAAEDGILPNPNQQSSISDRAILKLISHNAILRAPHIGYLNQAAANATGEISADKIRALKRERRACKDDLTGFPVVDLAERFTLRVHDTSDLTEALDRLRELAPRQFAALMLRYFCMMTVKEVAEELCISVSTVEQDWRRARAWLRDQLHD